MKRRTTLLACICIVLLSACTTDIEVNNPGLQAMVDGELFRSASKRAILYPDGKLVITGTNGDQTMSFTTVAPDVGTYQFSKQTISDVTFQKNNKKFASTNDLSDGKVVISEVYNNEITGQFFFNDLQDADGSMMHFRDGWFYRLPIENYVPIANEVVSEANPCLLNASLTATVDGFAITTTTHTAVPFGIKPPYPAIRITATDGNHGIEIIFAITSTPGQYKLEGAGDYNASCSFNNVKSAAREGTLTIIEHNQETKCISGSFEFTTRSGVVITDGQFDFGY